MPRMRALDRRTPGIPAPVLATLLATSLISCAGAPAPRVPGPEAPAVTPWALPPGAYPTQSLFRFQYDGPEGEGTLRLVLRLADPERYRLSVADRLGRPAVTVDAGPGGGYLLDHRESLACRLDAEVRIEEIPLDPLPLDAVPAVLLGRLPAAPREGTAAEDEARRLSFQDAAGRRWTAELAGRAGQAAPASDPAGEPVSWTLWRGGEPVLWWRRTDGEMLLSNRDRGVQMRWRKVGREPLAEPLPPPGIPPGYAPGTCTPRRRSVGAGSI
ncbi:MAG: hypothetical protein ACLF0P_14675 [Thermoanaerobaculia bacterium]